MCTYYTYIFKECWQWILTLLKHKFVFFISCCLWTFFFIVVISFFRVYVGMSVCVCVYLMVFGELLWLSEMKQYKTSPALGAQHTSAPNLNEQVIALCNSSGSLPFSWQGKRRELAYKVALKSVWLYRCLVGLWAFRHSVPKILGVIKIVKFQNYSIRLEAYQCRILLIKVHGYHTISARQ